MDKAKISIDQKLLEPDGNCYCQGVVFSESELSNKKHMLCGGVISDSQLKLNASKKKKKK